MVLIDATATRSERERNEGQRISHAGCYSAPSL
jgi:hypothetical protein